MPKVQFLFTSVYGSHCILNLWSHVQDSEKILRAGSEIWVMFFITHYTIDIERKWNSTGTTERARESPPWLVEKVWFGMTWQSTVGSNQWQYMIFLVFYCPIKCSILVVHSAVDSPRPLLPPWPCQQRPLLDWHEHWGGDMLAPAVLWLTGLSQSAHLYTKNREDTHLMLIANSANLLRYKIMSTKRRRK